MATPATTQTSKTMSREANRQNARRRRNSNRESVTRNPRSADRAMLNSVRRAGPIGSAADANVAGAGHVFRHLGRAGGGGLDQARAGDTRLQGVLDRAGLQPSGPGDDQLGAARGPGLDVAGAGNARLEPVFDIGHGPAAAAALAEFDTVGAANG